MALPHVPYANVTELDTPNLDDTYGALGNMANIPCTATGQNTIALTPVTNSPAITSYSQFLGVGSPVFCFTQQTTNTSGTTTININGIGAKNLYKNNGATLVGSSDLVAGNLYMVSYNSALNAAAGGFVIVNQVAGGSPGAVQGSAKNLTWSTTSNTAVNITADAIAVSDGATSLTTLLNVNVSPDAANSGANGLDTGSLTTSTWYYAFVIYNPTTATTAGLISLSSTSPTLPAGYTQFARVGADITDGSSHFLRIKQVGRRAQYVVGTNPTVVPNIANGTAGTFSATTPTLVTASVTGVVPPTAGVIIILATNTYKTGTPGSVQVAPNTAGYSGTGFGPQGSQGNLAPVFLPSGGGTSIFSTSMVLEGSTIAWASSGAAGAISCMGWEDLL